MLFFCEVIKKKGQVTGFVIVLIIIHSTINLSSQEWSLILDTISHLQGKVTKLDMFPVKILS